MKSDTNVPPILWRPSRPESTPIAVYRRHVNKKFNQTLKNTHDLHRWSVSDPQSFWIDLYSYLKLQPPLPPNTTTAYNESIPMSQIPAFFPGHTINYAENILNANSNPNAVALVGIREGQDISSGHEAELVTWQQFRERVRLATSALRKLGIRKGDRVAALMATSTSVIVLYHAAASIGAIFTSISPELGLEGCVSRLQQVTPSLLFVDSHAIYKGKAVSTSDKLEGILAKLSTPPKNAFVIPVGTTSSSATSTKWPNLDSFLSHADPNEPMKYERVPFNHPLMICYSSGTTGTPKCIVHTHSVIIQVKKISTLHNGLGPSDVIMQYSSTSWVVFYVMCGHMSVGAQLVCYNGSPLWPDAGQLLRICEKYGVTFLGASPRLLLEMEMAGLQPKRDFDLKRLRMVYTTGATLGNAQYRWFYGETGFPKQVMICNTAGGTDTATSLVSVDPAGVVHEGEMNVLALGMDIDVLDPATGKSIAESGQPGEMVIRKPFPSMPAFFWGDEGNKKYKESYFERFQEQGLDLWAQHDWLQKDVDTGGYLLSGRSDGVLNPSGIRFGSGEVYAIVETTPFTERISNTLCVGRRRRQDTDEQVFLFVAMKPGNRLTPEFRDELKKAIRNGLSPRHVPKFVLEVPEIPVTINGKKVEVAVKEVISGKDVKPSATVQNPDSIAYFQRFRNLDSEPKETKL